MSSRGPQLEFQRARLEFQRARLEFQWPRLEFQRPRLEFQRHIKIDMHMLHKYKDIDAKFGANY